MGLLLTAPLEGFYWHSLLSYLALRLGSRLIPTQKSEVYCERL
jgi:hypothetical protein